MDEWDRQKGETAKQYQYFEYYRDSGLLRSINKTSRKFAKSRPFIAKISSQNNWVARADAYDRHIAEITKKENIEAIKIANRENIEIANKIKLLGKAKVKATLKRIEAVKDNPELIMELADSIPWSTVTPLLNTAIDIERKAYGVTDEDLTLTVKGGGVDKINIEIKKKEMLSKLGVADVGMPEEPNLNG